MDTSSKKEAIRRKRARSSQEMNSNEEGYHQVKKGSRSIQKSPKEAEKDIGSKANGATTDAEKGKSLSKFRIPKVTSKSTDQRKGESSITGSELHIRTGHGEINSIDAFEAIATVMDKSSVPQAKKANEHSGHKNHNRIGSLSSLSSKTISIKKPERRFNHHRQDKEVVKNLPSGGNRKVSQSKKSRLPSLSVKGDQKSTISILKAPVPLMSTKLKQPDIFGGAATGIDKNKPPPPELFCEDDIMDWDNQVPEIRRLWDENSSVPCTANTEDDMEVDPTDVLILVPDTNIWIGCVNLLKQLLDTDFPKVGYPTIIIPWMVLQELDVKSKASEFKSARFSVKFIHDLLSSKHPRVKGQKASDAVLSQMKFDDIVADDSILQCAFQLQRADSTVVFLSNDRNLCNKALVHGLITFDSHDVVSKITKVLTMEDKLSINVNQSANALRKSSFHENIDVPRKTWPTIENPGSFNQSEDGHTFLPNRRTLSASIASQNKIPFDEVTEKLKNAIAYIIETKMKEDYGDAWICTVKIEPPWSLLSGVKCMILHWIAVFSFVFGPKGKSNAEELFELIKTCQNAHGNYDAEKNVAECAIGLLNMGKSSTIVQAPQVANCLQILMNFVASKNT